MNSIKFKPVAWLTAFNATLIAIIGAAQLYPIIPANVLTVLTFVTAVLSAILGGVTFTKVTPLARPRDNAGEPLVPLYAQRSAAEGRLAPKPRREYGDPV